VDETAATIASLLEQATLSIAHSGWYVSLKYEGVRSTRLYKFLISLTSFE
jgi:hypothetical protein